MPGEGDWRRWQPPSNEVRDQGSQACRVDGFAGCGQFGVRPPAVAAVVAALELIQPGGIYLVAGDAAEKEVIAEQPAGPAQVGAAGGVGDRMQVGGGDSKPGFFAQLACCGVREFLAFFDAAPGREPSVAGPDQQQPVRGIQQQNPCRPAGELRHDANGMAGRLRRRLRTSGQLTGLLVQSSRGNLEQPAHMSDHPIVAMACSAGGLHALTAVLAPLPGDLPAAVIALQHMPPDKESELPGILGRDTAMAVGWAEDGDLLTPGRVFAAPPGRHTLITRNETIALIPSGSVPPYRPSADLLLTTLALAAGRRVIAVVLSGEGQDAATGATAVHHFGGTVIVSSLESSARSAMPRATMVRDDITDYVVPVEDLAGLLLALTTAPLVEPAHSD